MVAREMRSHNSAPKALWHQTERQAETMVKRAAQRLRTKGFTVRSVVVKGKPKSRIIDFAVKQKLI
jgi:hypothetical protein